MTASTFATSEISNPGKINMILRSTRSGFKVIEDFADSEGSHNSAEAREMQRKAMNVIHIVQKMQELFLIIMLNVSLKEKTLKNGIQIMTAKSV